MRYRRILVAAVVLAGMGIAVPAVVAAESSDPGVKDLPRPAGRQDLKDPGYAANSVLVKFKKGASTAATERALAGRGATVLGELKGTGFVQARTAGDAKSAVAALRKDSAVEAVSLDYGRQLMSTPNDTYYASYQSYLKTVRLPQAWDRVKAATGQIIAVVDTGVDTGHPDLIGRTVPGYNTITPSALPTDAIGHGTMVAGIAAANTNNSMGIAGAAWSGRVMPIKVFYNNGTAYDSDIIEGIVWAVDHGAKIVNLSLGGPGDNPAIQEAMRYAVAKGALVVASAGNTGNSEPHYPAAYPEVLAVGATDAAGALTDFSTYGDWVDIAAPGFGIASTYPRATGILYVAGDGTSFSAPIVSGVAALTRTKFPTLTPAQVAERLRITARDAGPRGIDPYYGYGILDAYYAVGATWGSEFPVKSLGAGEPNDVPARATPIATSATGSFAIEGDVDWYTYTADTLKTITVTVNPPGAYDPDLPQNGDLMLEVYDSTLNLLGEADFNYPGESESVNINIAAGVYYIAVRNYNGAADARAYGVTVSSSTTVPAEPTPAGEQGWVRDVGPADFATSVALDVVPQVTFERALYPDSVTAETVVLVHGRTGRAVSTTPSYDPTTKQVMLTPATPLQDNTPYRIVVNGVRDASDVAQSVRFTTTFRTVNTAPPALYTFTATGNLNGAVLAWTRPALTDTDQVIVRMATGTVAPASPSTGTGVYAGTGSTTTITGLAYGTTYSFSIWVRDRSGMYSPPSTATLRASAVAISSNATSLTYGTTVTVTGWVKQAGTGVPIVGEPVQLWARRKGTLSFTLVATVTTSGTGSMSYVHKPLWSLDYRWIYRGSTTHMGYVSSVRAVSVRTSVSAALSATSISLGRSLTLSGAVAPTHPGKTVYLQRLVNGSWVTITSKVLSTTSRYSFTITPSSRGTYYYRVYKPADTDHLAGYSSTRSFKVI